jgi:hypothetical protein
MKEFHGSRTFTYATTNGQRDLTDFPQICESPQEMPSVYKEGGVYTKKYVRNIFQ